MSGTLAVLRDRAASIQARIGRLEGDQAQASNVRELVAIDRSVREYHRRVREGEWTDWWSKVPASVREAESCRAA